MERDRDVVPFRYWEGACSIYRGSIRDGLLGAFLGRDLRISKYSLESIGLTLPYFMTAKVHGSTDGKWDYTLLE